MEEVQLSSNHIESLKIPEDDNESCNSLSTVQEENCSPKKQLQKYKRPRHNLQKPLTQVYNLFQMGSNWFKFDIFGSNLIDLFLI